MRFRFALAALTTVLLIGFPGAYAAGDETPPSVAPDNAAPEETPPSVTPDAVAPDKNGSYTMVYMVEGGLCYPYTAIVVEK